MKHLSIAKKLAAAGLATVTLVGNAGVSANAASLENITNQLQIKGYAVVTGDCSEDVKGLLEELCKEFSNANLGNCPIISLPDMNKPVLPDDSKPETEVPSQPENGKPGTDIPNQPENGKPENDAETLSFAQQVVKLVNEERAKVGLSEVTLDKSIEAAALIRAKEIETSFSHTRPDGRSFSTVLTDNGITYRGSGENIAWGQRSPQEVMKGWMNSEGHRANILNPKFTKIGVGYYQNAAGRNYWTQLFTY